MTRTIRILIAISLLAVALVAIAKLLQQNTNTEIASQTPPNANGTTASATSSTNFASTTPDDKTTSYTLPNANDVIRNATFVKSLIGSDGARRGDVYISPVSGTTTAVSALYVISKINGIDEVVYAIESNVFINTAGEDFSVGREGLFGYRLAVRDDSFSVNPLYDAGKYEAEGILIQWYKNDNVFAVSPHSMSERGATLAKVFKSPKGFELARMYEQHDDTGKITNFDFMIEQGAGELDVLSIDLYGFYSSSYTGAEHKVNKDIDMKSYDLGSYQVVTSGADYLVIRPMLRNGQPAIGDVTVKWDYSNQNFDVQK
jgi:hypothetical protein